MKYEMELPDCPEGMEYLTINIPVHSPVSDGERDAMLAAARNAVWAACASAGLGG